MMNKIGILAALLIVPIVLQAMVYPFGVVAGDRFTFLILISLPCAAWVLGSLFAHRFWLVAGIFGALLPYMYYDFERWFIFWYQIDFLDSAAPYAARAMTAFLNLALVVLIPLCAFLAAKAARRIKVKEGNEK